jgi:hypothetical protein
LILIYDEFVNDPAAHLAALADFLRLPCGWADPSSLLQQRLNASEIPRFRAAFARAQRFGELMTRHDLDWIVRLARACGLPKIFGTSGSRPRLPDNVRQRLTDYYRDEITHLQDLLGRDLNGLWLARSR